MYVLLRKMCELYVCFQTKFGYVKQIRFQNPRKYINTKVGRCLEAYYCFFKGEAEVSHLSKLVWDPIRFPCLQFYFLNASGEHLKNYHRPFQVNV
jgi:hypothetical protein